MLLWPMERNSTFAELLMSWNWRQIIPTFITLAAMLCGFFSILLALEGHEHYLLSAKFIMLAMILDGLDGNLARRLKGTSLFGAELDTYVDMTAFGIAPAILIYQFTLHSYFAWRLLMTASVVLSGVIRLARFKMSDPYRGQAGYCGLPITVSAGWVALFVFLSESKTLGYSFDLNQGPIAILFLIGVMVMITLQVSTVRYPKPSKRIFLFVPCVVLVLLFFVAGMEIASKVAIIILVLGLMYVIAGPFFVQFSKRNCA